METFMKSRKGIGGNLNTLLWIVFIVVFPGGWEEGGAPVKENVCLPLIVENFRFEDAKEQVRDLT